VQDRIQLYFHDADYFKEAHLELCSVVEVLFTCLGNALTIFGLGKRFSTARHEWFKLENSLVVVVLSGNQIDCRVKLAVELNSVTPFVLV
jgi:hypothetical protein